MKEFFKRIFRISCQIITESLQDNVTGRYSSSRVVTMLVALAATVFMWKLVIVGGMTIEYFLAYLAYGSGNAGLNKFLDNKDTARNEQARTLNNTSVENQKDDPVIIGGPTTVVVQAPKPPKD